jgi:hypothetical protein
MAEAEHTSMTPEEKLSLITRNLHVSNEALRLGYDSSKFKTVPVNYTKSAEQ